MHECTRQKEAEGLKQQFNVQPDTNSATGADDADIIQQQNSGTGSIGGHKCTHTHARNYQIDKDLHMAAQPVRGECFIYNQSQNENEAGQFVDLEHQGSHCQC